MSEIKPDGGQRANANYYRCALYLASIYALTELSLGPFLYSHNLHTDGYVIRVVGAIIILIGIFLHSNFVRYVGGAWCVLMAGVAIWFALTSSAAWIFGFVWTIAVLLLCLSLAWFLLVSKTFSNEFSELRKKEPEYKKVLRKVLLTVLGAAAAIATLIDIYHLAMLS